MRRTIKRVVDGDTVEVNRNINGSRYVRLTGVNAPEKHQFGGKQATNTLRGLIGGRQVTITPEARDKYGRTVGIIRRNRENINRKMKRKGY